jgi:DNA-directed RNA polymerase specialized sigma24 family protein
MTKSVTRTLDDPMKPAVLRYQRTGAGRRELLDRIGAYVYRFPLWQGGPVDDDDCGEFYLYCRPRLQDLIDRFEDQGRPFEAYLKSVLIWQLRSYYRAKGRREAEWRLAASPPFWDPDAAAAISGGSGARAHGAPTALPAREDVAAAAAGNPAIRRRVLFALLKNCLRMHDTLMPAWADLCGRADLQALIGRARKAGSNSQRRWSRLSERSNHAFAKARMIEGQLIAEADAERRRILEQRLQRVRRTAASAREERQAVRLGPSNRQVAQLLGIPKGTVDTGLFWLKHRFPPR